jgi:TnpA family transposase
MQVTPVNNQSFWKQAYQDAVFELDHGHLRSKLEAAQKAIEDRLTELFSRGGTYREFMELGDAKRTIQFLEKHELSA